MLVVTVHNHYHARQEITPCQQQKETGWVWIISNWNCAEWQPIPQIIKDELHLHHLVGICSGMILTKVSANGLNELTQKVHKLMEK